MKLPRDLDTILAEVAQRLQTDRDALLARLKL